MAPAARAALAEALGDDVDFDVPMSRHTSLRVGGPADALARPAGRAELSRLLQVCAAHRLPHTVLGSGFNALVLDGGIEGVVIHLGLLVGSDSKTMLVATLVPTALMGVYHLFRSRRTLRGAVLISLGGSALFAVAFATANIGVLAQWLDKDVTLTGRIPMWEQLIPIAMEHPWLGNGYAVTFDGFFSPVHEVWIQSRWNPSHAHNALLQIWLEIGIFAAVMFLVVYLRAVTRAIKIVAIVPGTVGLWPLVFLTSTLMMSITESGMSAELLGWMMFVVSVLSVSLHLRHRDSLGLSNDLKAIAEANAAARHTPSFEQRLEQFHRFGEHADTPIDPSESIRIG